MKQRPMPCTGMQHTAPPLGAGSACERLREMIMSIYYFDSRAPRRASPLLVSRQRCSIVYLDRHGLGWHLELDVWSGPALCMQLCFTCDIRCDKILGKLDIKMILLGARTRIRSSISLYNSKARFSSDFFPKTPFGYAMMWEACPCQHC